VNRLPRIRIAVAVTKLTAGAGGVALRGALALDPDLFDPSILAADGGSLFPQAERTGLEVIRLRHMDPDVSPVTDFRGVRELEAILRGGRFDLVHTHSAKAGALGRIAARRVGVRAIIHTFHGFPFHAFQSPARRRTYIAAERRLGLITDQFLAVGAGVAAEAVRLGVAPPDRIRVIGSAIEPGIDVANDANRASARRLLGVPMDVPVIGSVGRLDYQKAPQDLVAAVASLGRADVHAVWIGGGPWAERVAHLAARRGLGNRFVLAGEREDVPALLPAFDVFAMSSLYEGVPCALVEAMACGIPAVATAVNAVCDVVVPGVTGLLARAGDPNSLARAISFLLDHPDRSRRMAVAARAYLGDRFHPATLGRDLTDVYSAALELERPAAIGRVAEAVGT
jgi:glycosyltransferase involved in cell wall biosynthesis